MYLYVFLFLFATIMANISSTVFGLYASIINAFLFIGLDLTSRDKLHELWHNKNLFLKTALLIMSGSIISWLINHNSGVVAIASFISFLASGIVDFVVYQIFYNKKYLIKVNGSNIFSAAADSILFPTIAFGQIIPLIILGQFIAKVAGGFIWSLILKKNKL
jgi:hypothetical protein